MSKVIDAVARPVRTGVQTGASFVIVELVDAFFYDMDDRQYGALVAALTLGLAFAQNFLENYTGKALLKEMPPKSVNVVEEDPNA